MSFRSRADFEVEVKRSTYQDNGHIKLSSPFADTVSKLSSAQESGSVPVVLRDGLFPKPLA